MKKGASNRKIVVIIMILISIYITPKTIWYLMPEYSLSVSIIDKTVTDDTYREHKGLHWILNNSKIKNQETNEYFDYEKDYYGFYPQKVDYKTRYYENINYQPDIIYLADSTGVLKSEYDNLDNPEEHPGLLFGGINREELYNIKSRLKNKNTLIGEFNIFSSPTAQDISSELQEIFNLKNTQILGRYFNDLEVNREIPKWIVNDYESQNKVKWNFKGNGIVIINSDKKIIVLEDGKDLLNKPLEFEFISKYKEKYNLKKAVSYYYWFEIIEPKNGSEIVGEFTLKTTQKGLEKLNKFGLPLKFPAITYYENDEYNSYYFSGDFVDIKKIPSSYNNYKADLYNSLITFDSKGSLDEFFWHCYTPVIKNIIEEAKNTNAINKLKLANEEKEKKYFEEDEVKLISRIKNNKFMIYENDKWKELFMKGINMGMATPGNWFTQMPREEYIYYEWFQKISNMNVNTIRVYTLCPPEFYNALYYFNDKNKENKLYLLQEIWPDENPKEHNYLLKENLDTFLVDIKKVVDAIHGNANIQKIVGKSYGEYTKDVSEYTIGYLVGRELEPEEVIATNELNEGFKFKGEYLSNVSNSATESWLAKSCDYLLEYETEKYNWQRPVSIVSWPTLDSIEHDSEWNISDNKQLEYHDKIAIDINNFNVENKNKAGFFGSYHIYPNYPDFINNEIREQPYKDEKGRLLYGNYLKEFMGVHKKYPALVAEFGIATGMGNAHNNPDGLNHGGLTEEEQGFQIIRMMNAIKKEGYIGGVIFEWMDEWAKKTWTTESFMIPYERKVLWHNMMDPEQNYGIMAYEATKPSQPFGVFEDNGEIKEVKLYANEEYLFLDFKIRNIKKVLASKKIVIGLDTYSDEKGQYKYFKNNIKTSPTGMEFKIELQNEMGKITITPDYNTSNYRHASLNRNDGLFEEMSYIINRKRIRKDGSNIEAIEFSPSNLVFGDFNISNTQWNYENDRLEVRLPWNTINFVDPSRLSVVDDEEFKGYPTRDLLKTKESEGIILTALIVDEENNILDIFPGENEFKVNRVKWNKWSRPKYNERLKKSYFILQEYLGKLK